LENYNPSGGTPLTELIGALSNPPKINPRKLDHILTQVTEEEKDALETALSEPDVWSADALSKTLTELNYKVSASSVKRYRREVLGL
jgi:hypothetical protein